MLDWSSRCHPRTSTVPNPHRRARPSRLKETPTSSVDPRPTRARVVAVEDDPDVRALLRALFGRSERFELVGEVADGDGAVTLALEAKPDVVLLDLMMPGLDGREVLPLLVEQVPKTMIAVLSSLRAVDEADGTFAAGAFAYLEKSLLGPPLIDELDDLYLRFQRALDGRTVWVPEIRPLPT